MLRVLVIKPSSLGDIVHGLQVMQSVCAQKPEVQISWVVRDRFAPLVEAAPFVHRVVVFRRRAGWRGLWAVCRQLRAGSWDRVLDMQGLLRSGLMTAAARAPEKWGRRDAREGAGWFYSKRIARPAGEGPWHAIDVLRSFIVACGAEPSVTLPLQLRPAPVFPWASFFEGDPRNRFVIFTDSRGPKKEWPYFAEFTRLLLAACPEARVAWCAGQRQEFGGDVPASRFLNLTGCPFEEMLALARQPSIFVGNDSGPMHLSAAVGNRVLAIFGPTPARRFGPYPLDDWRHRAVTAPGGVLRDLAPETVLAELLELYEAS